MVPRDTHDAVVDASVTDRIRSILSELEAADFELLDPPAEIWEAIEASITSSPSPSRREPPSRDFPANTVVEYLIDANDVVIDVGQSWAEIARDNGAPELVVLPSGRTLWTYFDSDETKDLWQLLVERVRALQKGAEVPLRCDAPDARRWFEMSSRRSLMAGCTSGAFWSSRKPGRRYRSSTPTQNETSVFSPFRCAVGAGEPRIVLVGSISKNSFKPPASWSARRCPRSPTGSARPVAMRCRQSCSFLVATANLRIDPGGPWRIQARRRGQAIASPQQPCGPHARVESVGWTHGPKPAGAVHGRLNAVPAEGVMRMVDVSELIEAALQARARAYAPYSGFRMGAAVLTTEGTVMPGSLVENVSLGLAMCAERVALFACVVAGQRPSVLVLVSPRTDGAVTHPCGACLQVALELGGPTLEVVAATSDGEVVRHPLGELLPRGPYKS